MSWPFRTCLETMLVCGLGHLAVFFPLPQHAIELARGIKGQSFVQGMRFDLVLSLLVVRCVEKPNWAVDSCLGWYRYAFWTGVVRGVPAYWRHVQKFSKSNPVCRTGAMTWKLGKAAKELESTREWRLIRSQPVAC